jgi:predicted  nucleic acid-binding Zn-ribbon protein
VKQLKLERENHAVEITALKAENASIHLELEKCNEDISLAEKRKESDSKLFENVKHEREVKALETDLERIDKRLLELSEKKAEIKTRVDLISAKLKKAEVDFENANSQISQMETDKEGSIVKLGEDLKVLQADFETKKASLPNEVNKLFDSAIESNYGRGIVFYKEGEFEGILQPLTPAELSKIHHISKNEILVLEDTSQIVVKAALDAFS